MTSRLLLLVVLVSLLPACTPEAWHKAFSSHLLTLSYDDFGPESIASQLLGPRGVSTVVIAYHGSTRLTPSGPDGVRFVNVAQAMYFLRRQVKTLPANEPLRQRLRATYARLYPLHRRHRDAILASAVALGRGRMSRMMMAPPAMPPSI